MIEMTYGFWVEETDRLIEAIGWDIEDARHHVIDHYSVVSRQLLNDTQCGEFLDFLYCAMAKTITEPSPVFPEWLEYYQTDLMAIGIDKEDLLLLTGPLGERSLADLSESKRRFLEEQIKNWLVNGRWFQWYLLAVPRLLKFMPSLQADIDSFIAHYGHNTYKTLFMCQADYLWEELTTKAVANGWEGNEYQYARSFVRFNVPHDSRAAYPGPLPDKANPYKHKPSTPPPVEPPKPAIAPPPQLDGPPMVVNPPQISIGNVPTVIEPK